MPLVTHSPTFWPRTIALVDMNAFFASIEQRDHAEWRGRPIAITNGLQGRQLCPELIQCPAHPERYAAISTTIMGALQDITPDIEIFSVDEAFLDVTHCQRLLGPPEQIARLAK
ncbi:MAG: DNA polymerase IV, partial [Pseudomonadota bacterium]